MTFLSSSHFLCSSFIPASVSFWRNWPLFLLSVYDISGVRVWQLHGQFVHKTRVWRRYHWTFWETHIIHMRMKVIFSFVTEFVGSFFDKKHCTKCYPCEQSSPRLDLRMIFLCRMCLPWRPSVTTDSIAIIILCHPISFHFSFSRWTWSPFITEMQSNPCAWFHVLSLSICRLNALLKWKSISQTHMSLWSVSVVETMIILTIRARVTLAMIMPSISWKRHLNPLVGENICRRISFRSLFFSSKQIRSSSLLEV